MPLISENLVSNIDLTGKNSQYIKARIYGYLSNYPVLGKTKLQNVLEWLKFHDINVKMSSRFVRASLYQRLYKDCQFLHENGEVLLLSRVSVMQGGPGCRVV
jgi:hypothetical protein